MVSSVTSYNNGVLAWHVEHDAQQKIYHIASKGSVPEQFKTILAASKKEQDEAGGEKAEVDCIHDVPIVLAQSITSFRHDQDIPNAPPEPFEVLASANAASSSEKPWWKLW